MTEMIPSAYVDTFARDRLPAPDLWPTIEFTTPQLQYPDRLNAATELIDNVVSTFGADRPALLTPAGEVWSYGQLQQRANQVAQVLTEDLGLVSGQRVFLRSPNNPWTLAAWLGVLKAGGIAVTTLTALRTQEIVPVIERTRPSIGLIDHRFVEDASAACSAAMVPMRIVPYGGDGPEDLVSRAVAKRGEFTNVSTAADDVALLCPTSGTTGTPKITMHFHRDILSIDNTFGYHVLKLTADDLVACSAPFAFTFGLGMSVVFPMRAGARMLLVESAPPAALAELVSQHGVTVLATAPTAYRAIIRDHHENKLAGLRLAVSAGEHLSKDVWLQLRDTLGLKVIDGIGCTELLHVFIATAGDDIRPGATGKPVPGYRATILGPDDTEVGPGEPGRLGVIGPTGCRYLDDERQRDYVVDGWNVTGDVFYTDADGYYYYEARKDGIIVSSGYNIAAPEVEAAVETHPDVMECGVIGRPDTSRGSVICAFVVLRADVPGDSAKVKEIQDHVKQTLAPFKYPRDVRFCSALPRNPSGKLQRFMLYEMLDEHSMVDQ